MDNKCINFNSVEILIVCKDGIEYLPIKPICEAIGIDAKAQRDKIQEDEFFKPVGVIIPSPGADGKNYDMFCLPVKFIYGWLATINPGKVAPEAKKNVIEYRRECYEVLYNHFHNTLDRQLKANEAELKLLKELNAVILEEKEAKARRRKIEESLGRLRSERLNPQPQLDL
ncbi:MAG: hypothetical protein BHV69_09525 [Bacteroidales bacterium 52_46]|nr:MAG: hypothetical protein BHV69_09525 [Bacteroidales bacterium 52_46]